MQTELKPCPFCGDFAVIEVFGEQGAFISCVGRTCKMQRVTTGIQTQQEAIQAWNNRAGEES